jgi:hypothetical protein
MSFSFVPKTDAEIEALQNQGLLTEGTYPFQVKAIDQLISKSGNSMLKVKLSVLEKDGSARIIFDYLVAMDTMMFKIKHFCESIGLADQYSKGMFDPQECIDRSGMAILGIQKGNAKPDGTGNYADKNSIKDYVKSDKLQKAADDKMLNEDIPF